MAIKTFTTYICDICGEKQAIRRRMLAYRTFDANDGRRRYDKPVLEQVEIDLCDKCAAAATNLHDIGVCREEYEIRRIGQ